MKWKDSLTLACGDVAVSPVDPVFMVGDVAPGLHIPIRVPAGVRGSLHQPTSTWGVLLTDSLRVWGGGGGGIPGGEHQGRSGTLAKVSKADDLDHVSHPPPRWQRPLLLLFFLFLCRHNRQQLFDGSFFV